MANISGIFSLALVLSFALFLSGCVSSGVSEFPSKISPGETFTIRPGESVSFGDSRNNFTLVGVYSSLCPPKVKCVWEGDVRVKASIIGPGGESLKNLSFIYQNQGSGRPLREIENATYFDGAHFFELVSISPDPYVSRAGAGHSSEYATFQYSTR